MYVHIHDWLGIGFDRDYYKGLEFSLSVLKG